MPNNNPMTAAPLISATIANTAFGSVVTCTSGMSIEDSRGRWISGAT